MTRRLGAGMAGLLVLLALAGCSPEYDWRELDAAGGRVRAAFPAKVIDDTRRVTLAGHEIPFTLEAARRGNTVFAVGHIVLPPGDGTPPDPKAQQEVVKALLASWYTNVGVPVPDPLPPLGETVDISSSARGVAMRFVGKAVVHQGAIVEWMVTGPAGEFPEEPAKTFMTSPRLLGATATLAQ
ncbi:hypothetical protein ANT2_4113 [plant metagenome]|uniref:Lipoprotein n=1 Tax=plant metagenome TaxID=1297885 RepID=A0A484T8P7_9ZZZZ